MTDVDPATDASVPTTPAELASRMAWLPAEERALLENTSGDFYRESMEVGWGAAGDLKRLMADDDGHQQREVAPFLVDLAMPVMPLPWPPCPGLLNY